MSIKITRWTPDTCSCTVEYSWDSAISEDNRVHSFHNYVNKCSSHSHLEDSAAYTTVVKENQKKNLGH